MFCGKAEAVAVDFKFPVGGLKPTKGMGGVADPRPLSLGIHVIQELQSA